MWDQVKGVYMKMKPIMDTYPDSGVNLICYSQGVTGFIKYIIY